MNYRHTLIAVLGAFALLITTGCGSKRGDYAVEKARLTPDGIQIYHIPIVNTVEMGTTNVSGEAERTYILGIPIWGDSIQGETHVIFDSVGQRPLTGIASLAASRGIDSVGADGLYITRMEANRSGLVPIIYSIKYEVQGKPVTITESEPMPRNTYIGALTHPDHGNLRTRPDAPVAGGFLGTLMSLPPFSFLQ